MKGELEHREGTFEDGYCWCLPIVEHYKYADVVIHNEADN